MTNTITCKVQGGDKLKALLHIPKNGSTFLFYWHKDKIMMKTAGRMTLILESPKKGGNQ